MKMWSSFFFATASAGGALTRMRGSPQATSPPRAIEIDARRAPRRGAQVDGGVGPALPGVRLVDGARRLAVDRDAHDDVRAARRRAERRGQPAGLGDLQIEREPRALAAAHHQRALALAAELDLARGDRRRVERGRSRGRRSERDLGECRRTVTAVAGAARAAEGEPHAIVARAQRGRRQLHVVTLRRGADLDGPGRFLVGEDRDLLARRERATGERQDLVGQRGAAGAVAVGVERQEQNG